MEKKCPADRLRMLVKNIIEHVGLTPDMAEVFADTLVSADLRGVKSHGTVRLSGPAKTGHIFCAVDIDHFIGIDPFKKNMDKVIKRIKSLPSKNDQEIFLPGEIEFNLSEKRSREGIPLEDAVVENLNALGARYQLGYLG